MQTNWNDMAADISDPVVDMENIENKIRIDTWTINNPYAMPLVKQAYIEGRDYAHLLIAGMHKQVEPEEMFKLFDTFKEDWQLLGFVKGREGEVLPPYPSKELKQIITLCETARCGNPWLRLSTALQRAVDAGLWDGFIEIMADIENGGM